MEGDEVGVIEVNQIKSVFDWVFAFGIGDPSINRNGIAIVRCFDGNEWLFGDWFGRSIDADCVSMGRTKHDRMQ